MLKENDLWLMDAELAIEEPSDVLLTVPEMRELLEPDADDDGIGLRSMLERPEALSKAWSRTLNSPRERASRHGHALRAA